MKQSRALYEKVLVSHQIVPYFRRKNQPRTVKYLFNQLWQTAMLYLTRPPEPKVRKKSNRRGDIWWEVYDPQHNLTANFTSEAEVRMWLDQRHY